MAPLRPYPPVPLRAIVHALSVSAALALAACKPPAADEYVERIAIDDRREAPSMPIDTPNTEGAIWADSTQPDRMLYGNTGQPAIFALGCEKAGAAYKVHITRFIAADPQAKGLMALIGNGHIARLPVDSVWNGKVWLWEGYYDPRNPDLDVLTGPRKIEATIPGAGSVVLNPSPRPAQLIDHCRQLSQPSGE
ncbi:hypothetical protein GCM10023115_23510 [Pontixanthobacter gangjinensis]|uniref:Lipoprotein n=1 Tax=Pontixanthobacter gangjinensis TaxID=1028742 RepID=A0A6I4SRD9_9SPHN|nr:hypothetical protein [Pontixanthobacter gangjinensis]MXO57596.1 hypothetical protein [Pontixanthobacter gangjinensis]